MRDAYHSPAWPALRLAVLNAARWRCYWCGDAANEADHLVAIAEGGAALDRRNLVASCRRCNGARGAKVRKARIGRRSRRW